MLFHLFPAAGDAPTEVGIPVTLHEHREISLDAHEVFCLYRSAARFAEFEREAQELLRKTAPVTREMPDKGLEVATLVLAETVVAEDEYVAVGTDALLQALAPQDRSNSLELAAVHIVVHGVHVALELKDMDIQRITGSHPVAQVDDPLERRDVIGGDGRIDGMRKRRDILVHYLRVDHRFLALRGNARDKPHRDNNHQQAFTDELHFRLPLSA